MPIDARLKRLERQQRDRRIPTGENHRVVQWVAHTADGESCYSSEADLRAAHPEMTDENIIRVYEVIGEQT